LLSNAAGKDEQGFVSGLNTTYMSMGNIAGPILAGSLFDKQINLPYTMAAIILFGAIFLAGQRKKVTLRSKCTKQTC
jgi:DHA1 family multidrug resistance protein-like MFS transporter